MMSSYRSLSLLLVLVSQTIGLVAAIADIIPPSNRIDWSSVAGVENGIPDRQVLCSTTQCAALASIDKTGATNVLPQVQAAINSCPKEQVVKLPVGIFRLDGTLSMRDYMTLRGSGAATVLKTDHQIYFSNGLGRVNVDAESGYVKTSTRLVLKNAPTGLTVGSSFVLNELNNTDYVHPYGYEEDATLPLLCSYCDEPDGGQRARGQMVRATGINGKVVDFTPALYTDFSTNLMPRIHYPVANGTTAEGAVNMRVFAGVEDLTIDLSGDAFMMRFEQAQNCWVKNVTFEIRAADYPAIIGYLAHRISIKHSTFNGHSGQSSAILSQIHTEGWLVENNIFKDVNQTFLNVGRQGAHVFSYNYLSAYRGITTALTNDNGNHGAHPEFLLFEGNKLVKHHADSIHGSSSSYTLFRNHFRCRQSDTTFGAGCIWIDSWNYNYNVVGNVLGLPGMTDWFYESVCPGALDDSLYIFRYGYSGYNDYKPPSEPANGPCYPRSKSTTLRHGNYIYGLNTVEWDSTIADHTIPKSLYLGNSKPGWFGDLNWPPIGPDTNGLYTSEIPAEYRFKHGGNDPPGVNAGTTPSLPNSLRVISR